PEEIDGYTFDGWYADEACTVLFHFDKPLSGDTAVYARYWNNAVYTVVYASATPGFNTIEEEYQHGGIITPPQAQTIAGFVFNGWYADEACTVQYNFDEPIEANKYIWAKYSDDLENYAFVTFVSATGNFNDYRVKVAKGSKVTAPSAGAFSKTGFSVVWMSGTAEYDFNAVVNGDLTLTAKWNEDELVLYHKMSGVVDPGWKYDYSQDENGWDRASTSWQLLDTFVDEDGNEVISSYYGSLDGDTYFSTWDPFSEFVLMGVGNIANLKRLDVTKEIVISFSTNKTSHNPGDWGCNISFSLFDSLLAAFKAPANLGGLPASPALVSLVTQTKADAELYGKIKDVKTGTTSSNFGFVDDEIFKITIYISEDGVSNYLKVNGAAVAGALAGVKQSDFTGGYAYLHLQTHGASHWVHALVSQTSNLTVEAAANGTVTADVSGTLLFKDKVTLTCTPSAGYMVKHAVVGGKTYLPDADGKIVFHKGWDDETVTVEFAKECVATFNSMGGSAVEPQSVNEGDVFFKPSNPKKDGYNFIGWYTDEACTQAYVFTTPAMGDITLYAKWEAKDGETVKPEKGCKKSIGAALTALTLIGLAGAALFVKKK
ncbi:MAG: InlB B-repeat-containing protein, partial [Firmicutes bacterium]|nr:InlB B-repeat-containing protein [Bacillota bacterium]